MKRPKKSKFWFKQPVSRLGTKLAVGHISKEPLPPLTSDAVVKGEIPSQEIVDFINANYMLEYIYTLEHLKEIRCIVARHNGQLRGVICSRMLPPMTGIVGPLYYVDYLTVHKKHRNKGLAPVLISHMAQSVVWPCSFLFKVEHKPLPFDYIAKCQYYTLDICSTIGANNSRLKPGHAPFEFFERCISKYAFRPIITKSEYEKMPNTFVAASAFLSLQTYQIRIGTQVKRIGEIVYCFGCDFDDVIATCKARDIDYILMLNNMDNGAIIARYPFTPSATVYYHLYNYSLKKRVYEPGEFAFT